MTNFDNLFQVWEAHAGVCLQLLVQDRAAEASVPSPKPSNTESWPVSRPGGCCQSRWRCQPDWWQDHLGSFPHWLSPMVPTEVPRLHGHCEEAWEASPLHHLHSQREMGRDQGVSPTWARGDKEQTWLGGQDLQKSPGGAQDGPVPAPCPGANKGLHLHHWVPEEVSSTSFSPFIHRTCYLVHFNILAQHLFCVTIAYASFYYWSISWHLIRRVIWLPKWCKRYFFYTLLDSLDAKSLLSLQLER